MGAVVEVLKSCKCVLYCHFNNNESSSCSIRPDDNNNSDNDK